VTAPCLAPLGCRWEAEVYALRDAAGLRLVVARDREGSAWTVYDPIGTMIRDGVSDGRLPEVVAAALNRPPTD